MSLVDTGNKGQKRKKKCSEERQVQVEPTSVAMMDKAMKVTSSLRAPIQAERRKTGTVPEAWRRARGDGSDSVRE